MGLEKIICLAFMPLAGMLVFLINNARINTRCIDTPSHWNCLFCGIDVKTSVSNSIQQLCLGLSFHLIVGVSALFAHDTHNAVSYGLLWWLAMVIVCFSGYQNIFLLRMSTPFRPPIHSYIHALQKTNHRNHFSRVPSFKCAVFINQTVCI
jgi:hypothetical protein